MIITQNFSGTVGDADPGTPETVSHFRRRGVRMFRGMYAPNGRSPALNLEHAAPRDLVAREFDRRGALRNRDVSPRRPEHTLGRSSAK